MTSNDITEKDNLELSLPEGVQEQCKLTKVPLRGKLIRDKVCRSAVSMNRTYFSVFIHAKRGSAFHIYTKCCFVDGLLVCYNHSAEGGHSNNG